MPLFDLVFRKNYPMSLVQFIRTDSSPPQHPPTTFRHFARVSVVAVLFSILMTVLLFDVSAKLHLRLPRSSSDTAVDEHVCADDTMVVAVDASRVESYVSAIAPAGMDYGSCFNWRKGRMQIFHDLPAESAGRIW